MGVVAGGNLDSALFDAGGMLGKVVAGGPNVFVLASCSWLNPDGTKCDVGILFASAVCTWGALTSLEEKSCSLFESRKVSSYLFDGRD